MVLLISAVIVLAGMYHIARKMLKDTKVAALVAAISAVLVVNAVALQLEGADYTTAMQGTTTGIAVLFVLAYAGKRQLRALAR